MTQADSSPDDPTQRQPSPSDSPSDTVPPEPPPALLIPPLIGSAEGSAAAIALDDRRQRPGTRPRVFPVFLAWVVALGLAVTFQALIGIAIAVAIIRSEGVVDDIEQRVMDQIMSPWGFMGVIAASQAAFLVTALVGARLSKEPIRTRLGVVPSRLPHSRSWPLAVATYVPFAIGLGLMVLILRPDEPDPSLVKLFEAMTPASALAFILMIAIPPGICEELFFRGLMQRRLLARWSPFWAILVTSICFALAHGAPGMILYTFPIGIWLGVIAWRTGSIVPGMICHAFLNGTWNVLNVGSSLWGWTEAPPLWVTIPIGGMVIAAFVASVIVLWRAKPTSLREKSDQRLDAPQDATPS